MKYIPHYLLFCFTAAISVSFMIWHLDIQYKHDVFIILSLNQLFYFAAMSSVIL